MTGEEAGSGSALGEAASQPRSASIAGGGACSAQSFSADELLALVEAGTDWIWQTDHELRFSWLSANYQDVTGIAPNSVLGRFRFDFLKQVSKGSAAAEAHLADLEARRPFRDFVYELNGGKPECRWVSITGYPRFDRRWRLHRLSRHRAQCDVGRRPRCRNWRPSISGAPAMPSGKR